MNSTITVTVNGERKTVTTDPKRSLLDVLREDLLLTGTKYGCGEGQCRACSVLVNGASVAACMKPVSSVENQAIITIEGVSADARLRKIQEAFLAENAFQCGYCTPGMIMELAALLLETPRPTGTEIFARMNRHLCRCAHYPAIKKAIQRITEPANK